MEPVRRSAPAACPSAASSGTSRHALPTVLAVMGLQFAHLLGGSTSSRPCYGPAPVPIRIFDRDMPVLQGRSCCRPFVLTNLVDILSMGRPAISRSSSQRACHQPPSTLAPASARRSTVGRTRIQHIRQNVRTRQPRPHTMACIAILLVMAPPRPRPAGARRPDGRQLGEPATAAGLARPHPGNRRAGRDMLSRLVYGARLSLAMGVVRARGARDRRTRARRRLRRRSHQHAHHG
jgi:hypothetical protein